MFEEPEWAEEPHAPATRPPPISRARSGSAPRAKGLHRQSLQATLQALQAEAFSYQLINQGDNGSDSESDSGEKKRKKRKKTPKKAPLMEENSKLIVQGIKSKKEESKGSGVPKSGDLTPVLPQKDSGLQRPTLGPMEDGSDTGPRLSRKQWRNRQKNKRRQKNKFLPPKPLGAPTPEEEETRPAQTGECEPELGAGEPGASLDRGGVLRAKMKQRLEGARFRFLNERLYSVTSSTASHIFQEDPEAFELYHRGFQNQLKRWPLKPVDRIVKDLKQRPASLVVADFGCGDCRLASSVKNTVHCFDLAALDPRVTVCDMAQVPLKDESVDIAVFCLSLMGTNLSDFLKEANRVLKPGGLLKVAEVASRFVDMRGFLGALAQLGFKLVSKDLSNSYFYLLNFHKIGPPKAQGPLRGLTLRPCLYKRR
ncbi:ribosomal RNA-processing protein 8 [Gracilinanus agilis]|uniref:ribosomal RNA-processing protein 8 n=1 Tax=Gracilinanus agilis TaxID=191870 RepID=UPI001CFD392A|nr:ribosomal RNA-processing protein 8 [Gracilinanus agilis]